ncbi:MAG: YdcF family protein, partial [Burkholderiaceae bacterium]
VPAGARESEANLMAKVLVEDYGITPKWIDNAAATTRGNAQMAAKDLKPLGIQRVVLVTTAIHMPRSKRAFEVAGFSVIPAATDYVAQRPFTVAQLMPRVSALTVSYYALREWISRVWYRVIGS